MRPILLPPYGLTEQPLGSNDRDLVSPDAILRFIRRSWRLCLIWVFVCLCVGVAFAVLSPAYYTAYTTILLEDRTLRPLADPAGGAIPADPGYPDSQVQILQSDEVVGRVVEQNRLAEDPEFGPMGDSLISYLRTELAVLLNPGRAGIKATPRHATTIRFLRALSVRRVGITNVVEIGFTSRDPLRSAAIANAIAQSYIEGQLELKLLARAEAASHLKERLAELRDKAFGAGEGSQESSGGTPGSEEQARVRFREMQNRVDTFRALYNNVLQRAYAEPDSQVFANARVITSAEPPLERSWPRAVIVLVIAAAGGAVGGIGHALIRVAMDHSLRTVQDVQRLTGLDCIAGVATRGERAERTSGACESLQAVEQGLQTVYLQRLRGLYDAMVKVAVRLQADQSKRNGVIIGVVAPTKGAGASSVAAHLARIIAESGQRTLLVDANWQRPLLSPPVLSPKSDQKPPGLVATIYPQTGSLDFLVIRAAGPISEVKASVSIIGTLQNQQPDYNCTVVDFHSTEQTSDFEAGMALINKLIVVVEARRTSSDTLDLLLRLVPRENIVAVILNKV